MDGEGDTNHDIVGGDEEEVRILPVERKVGGCSHRGLRPTARLERMSTGGDDSDKQHSLRLALTSLNVHDDGKGLLEDSNDADIDMVGIEGNGASNEDDSDNSDGKRLPS